MINNASSKRWVILRHTFSKESMEGLHFDLLLEDRSFCRTWRLANLPSLGGPFVEAIPLPPHSLHWLEKEESSVSGGRGWAKRILDGQFYGSLPLDIEDAVSIEIRGSSLNGKLQLAHHSCQLLFST